MAADLVPIATALLTRLADLGVDVAHVLERASLPRARFEGAKVHVTTREFFAFWRVIEETGARRDLGIRLGSAADGNPHNVATLAAMSSKTFGDGLDKLARYKRLVCPEQITWEVTRGEARIRFEWVLAEEDPPRLLIDGVFASALALARRTGKPMVPRRIELTRRRADEALLRQHFGCEVRFDAPFDLLVFDEGVLAEPLATENAELLEVLIPGLDAALGESKSARTLVDDVRSALSRRISGERPAVEKVAKTLGMSSRTLQRRLGELGTSYQEILDDVRRRIARRLLGSTDLESAEVAFLLGFEEHNSFARAFHGWHGVTPARWRAIHAVSTPP